MIDRINRHLPVSYDTIKKRYGMAYLTACVKILLKMNASTRLWYNCGQKLFDGRYDKFCLSYTGGRTSNQYTVNVDGTWYCIRLGQFFGDDVTTLHIGALESLSKFYNFLLKHKNEDLSVGRTKTDENWRPKMREKFYVASISKVRFDIWRNTEEQRYRFAQGICFATEEEAETHRQKMIRDRELIAEKMKRTDLEIKKQQI